MSDFGAVWTPAALGNYDANRLPVNLIIVHHTACPLSAAQARFDTPGTQVSAHFIVAQDGTVYEVVPIGDTAYHSGDYTINERSVGIEHESGPVGQDFFTDAQYAASQNLIKAIANHFGFPVDTDHVWPHHQVVATACPGVLDVNRLINGGGSSPVVTEQEIKFDHDIVGQVYDITSGVFTAANGTKSSTTLPDNDCGFYDYTQAPNGYTSNDALVGQTLTCDRARLTAGVWYWGLKGSTWAINDNAFDVTDQATKDGHPDKTEPTDFAPKPVVVPPPPVTPPTPPPPPVTPPPPPPVVAPPVPPVVPGKGCLAALFGIR